MCWGFPSVTDVKHCLPGDQNKCVQASLYQWWTPFTRPSPQWHYCINCDELGLSRDLTKCTMASLVSPINGLFKTIFQVQLYWFIPAVPGRCSLSQDPPNEHAEVPLCQWWMPFTTLFWVTPLYWPDKLCLPWNLNN